MKLGAWSPAEKDYHERKAQIITHFREKSTIQEGVVTLTPQMRIDFNNMTPDQQASIKQEIQMTPLQHKFHSLTSIDDAMKAWNKLNRRERFEVAKIFARKLENKLKAFPEKSPDRQKFKLEVFNLPDYYTIIKPRFNE